jgi:hypothetical protein
VLDDELGKGITDEWWCPRQHLIEHDAQGVNIGSVVGVLCVAFGLLGGHVRWRSKHDACLGLHVIPGRALVGLQFCDTKVQYLYEVLAIVTLGDEEVLGFDVSMDDTLRMCGAQGGAHLSQ